MNKLGYKPSYRAICKGVIDRRLLKWRLYGHIADKLKKTEGNLKRKNRHKSLTYNGFLLVAGARFTVLVRFAHCAVGFARTVQNSAPWRCSGN